MAKITLNDWRMKTFAGTRPTLRACQNWANQGHIPGAVKIGGLWFVDEQVEKQAAGNSRVAKVLAG